MHTEDSAAGLPAPKGRAHKEDASVFDEQVPEHSFGSQQSGGSFAVSPLLQGAVKLLAGAFMLLAGINLLGLFPALGRLRMPRPKLRGSSRLPFVIGLLNGLMPCGPLQAIFYSDIPVGNSLIVPPPRTISSR